ncbi:vWA domain-containing protein [Paludisphaera soli]|uniref:vWA domain-containing protein n=1 Tax=Paludisphaera soli TaxID=2712865 RepID=UPI0013EDA2A4|nr:VWA domain-containing protein [Paludisphaera soli]
MPDPVVLNQRQMLYWRLLAATSGLEEAGSAFEATAVELADRLELPPAILDPGIGVDVLLHRHPKLKPHFDAIQGCLQESPEGAAAPPPDDEVDLRRTFAYSKLLLNVFGPNTRSPSCSAAQYNQWCQDVAALERCMGMAPGSLRPGGGASGGEAGAGRGGPPGLGGSGFGVSGNAPRIDDRQLREELTAMESDLVKRMDLREVLKDDRLAAQLTPTPALVEQLLRDKSNLTGPALANARRLIKKYVDDLAAVLKKQVFGAKTGVIDRSVTPRRVYRNLDLKRTIWKNLPNYNPEDGRLYVDRLFYRHTARKSLNKYLIVVVDQSGSMVDAMVQCAILASIFATLPRVVVSLVAFDTNVIDLTPWAADPFESLMRTDLGGGNDGPKAMLHARGLIVDPRRTTMVWISDFYEFHNDRPLFEMIKAVKQSGVHFVPVGSVSGRGYFSVNEWFRKQLKGIGLPVLTGNIKKLIVELKKQLN